MVDIKILAHRIHMGNMPNNAQLIIQRRKPDFIKYAIKRNSQTAMPVLKNPEHLCNFHIL